MTEARVDDSDHFDGYIGPAELRVREVCFPVEVTLRGFFHPAVGRYQWYGRVRAQDELAALVKGRKQEATLSTPSGEAVGVLSDPDLWGRYRLVGYSKPPFEVTTDMGDED
ncbi:DUF4873 domain-containing protein [Nocardia cyriacigeorgica]|uniref:DUF4873 domain-containing protein n=1 Tax=Nocardia cyriacigeorgica TaxID=135487 RepID=A0A5R8PCZ6_9NOCA|nr:DUF4873 domain-containing protein [Nocardia cyriacigeorgica]TLG08788.1 DUF4873 domain-containing protein [Nocardia cyriacigeorgica]